jgi:hypothetical protein
VTDIPVDKKTRVAYVAAISNEAAPTTTELNAGLLLHSVITPDGLQGFEAETADVPTDALDSDYDTVTIGRITYSGTGLMLKKQSGTDTVYSTLAKGTEGFLVVRRYLLVTTAWTAGQTVEVYPIICGERRHIAPEKNTVARYFVPTKVHRAPTTGATVA